MFDYTVKRTNRRTYSIAVLEDGSVIVRAPLNATDRFIGELVGKHAAAIERRIDEMRRKYGDVDSSPLSDEELKILHKEARAYFTECVRKYEKIIGVKANRISISAQTTRWGSASSKGNVNFNCILMLAPEKARESVVVHELCHLKHMNHSQTFYDACRRVFPEYDEWHRWTHTEGRRLMFRLRKTKE